ncbi:2OG-Fe(II) oxygenase [uncultured Prochlorococcus sp.]|uniref:2OG-Fe(II) oxygenase n=1 Tax=uncultured Prochlorococcus sp. TaxID=159733 RepID=UPI002588357F|nr:2OG-Fe(II) oxygenase [uncultured Prochlorococcus sp.]
MRKKIKMNRDEFADYILNSLRMKNVNKLKSSYKESSLINYLSIDDLLPYEVASLLDAKFPKKKDLFLCSGPQEKKYVAVNWKQESKIVEECLYAFQDKRVIKIISEICQIKNLVGDPELYAGGVSYMNKNCFLNPHIDNSHDRLRKKYRRLNLLYYVSKRWDENKDGGELLLYPNGIKFESISIPSKFNRLVLMRTDNKSIHAVNHIKSNFEARKCISNYYFSYSSPLDHDYYHSTSFRGFKGEILKDLYLKINSKSRTLVKKLSGNFFGKFINTGHYRKDKK